MSWRSRKSIKRPAMLTVDGSLSEGTFAVQINRFQRRSAAASIRLRSILRWAGDREELRFNIHADGGSIYRGTALFPMTLVQQMRSQFESVLSQLYAKAKDFENRCARHEYRDDVILAN